MTEAGTVAIGVAANGMKRNAKLRFAVRCSACVAARISSRVFLRASSSVAFATGIRGAVPPAAG
jgi:hypothetical protein